MLRQPSSGNEIHVRVRTEICVNRVFRMITKASVIFRSHTRKHEFSISKTNKQKALLVYNATNQLSVMVNTFQEQVKMAS